MWTEGTDVGPSTTVPTTKRVVEGGKEFCGLIVDPVAEAVIVEIISLDVEEFFLLYSLLTVNLGNAYGRVVV